MNQFAAHGRVKLFLKDSRTSISWPIGQTEAEADDSDLLARTRINLSRSALQRPELNRAHLAAMLRKALRKSAKKKSKAVDWSSFMTHYSHQNASNSNFSE